MQPPKIVRRDKFDLVLSAKKSRLIGTPTDAQRNWLLTRSLDECADDIEHLDRLASALVPGSARPPINAEWSDARASGGASELLIDGQQVMQAWQGPYMAAMAAAVAQSGGDILEIGFGLGIAASHLQAMSVRSHTIVECNRDVYAQALAWQKGLGDGATSIVLGDWRDVLPALGQFDGILFDAYPVSEAQFDRYVVNDITFAHHFFDTAARHLRPGGAFVYFSNEIDSMSRRHQRALLDRFSVVTVSVCRDLAPPPDCQVWWSSSILVIKATK